MSALLCYKTLLPMVCLSDSDFDSSVKRGLQFSFHQRESSTLEFSLFRRKEEEKRRGKKEQSPADEDGYRETIRHLRVSLSFSFFLFLSLLPLKQSKSQKEGRRARLKFITRNPGDMLKGKQRGAYAKGPFEGDIKSTRQAFGRRMREENCVKEEFMRKNCES